ncbi:MAG: efflux RND transporter permease subunit [Myxococcales bacterium]|nr:efflux RND transporter permease subunit [Myxococcales bacterium]
MSVIDWMVRHRVAPNLLMVGLMAGGLLMTRLIKQEVFPEFERDMVNVVVAYPGASPAEIEQAVILAIEEGVRGLEGVKEVASVATEGLATVNVELLPGADRQRAYQEIKQQVDRIRTFPADTEKPQVTLQVRRREVLDLQVYGKASETVLRDLAEQVRDRLLALPEITQVELIGARTYEVHVDVPRAKLREHGLSLGDIARVIGQSAVEVPGGGVKTRGGEILLRVKQRRNWAREFAKIPLLTTAQGTVVRLGDIARVIDDFEEVDRSATFNGLPAIGMGVFRVGDETPIGISEAVERALPAIRAALPPGIHFAISRDRSKIYASRLRLLLKNAALGLLLVLVTLGLFLQLRLAFWVVLGIPTSFLGGLVFMPAFGVTINIVSLFAFILALGIVVDDAIVVGENVHEHRARGMSYADAAVRGTREIAGPVSFSILTNIVAFLPFLYMPGTFGKIWYCIPLVVSLVFTMSWIESIYVLPAHLAHESRRRPRVHEGIVGLLSRGWTRTQGAVADGLAWFVARVYARALRTCIRHRYLTVAFGVALIVLTVTYVTSGRLGMVLMPKVESDRAVVTAVLPYGSPFARAVAVRDKLVRAATVVGKTNGGDKLVRGIFASVDANIVEVTVYLTGPLVRPISTAKLTRLWRTRAGPIAGLQSLRYESDRGGPGSGPSITIELTHRDIATLDRASSALAAKVLAYSAVKDVDDGYAPGKPQLNFEIKLAGRSLGLTANDVGRQVRAAFYGAEALRQQRGRNEVKVLVRLPHSERKSEYDIERMLVRTPAGVYVPLSEVARVKRGRAYTQISRRDGRRAVRVTATVEPIRRTNEILASVKAEVLPKLLADFPGLNYSFEGRQADMRDSLRGLGYGFIVVLALIYLLLAVPFRSYAQPLIIMAAIPFGIVGASLGHLMMGYSMSIISMMGILALSGVVVNDALVMIDYANARRKEGAPAAVCVYEAGVRRFRPILLTTLTTFGGLAPMIFETSRQARFIIPMAISLGYGILFATAITLVLVPCLYLIVDDGVSALARRRER